MIPIVIIHGWSDNSNSFKKLARAIQKKTGRKIEELWLADYISRDDEVTMKDIIIAMQAAWKNSGLPTASNSVDVIVHSTGGLVIRDWMRTYWPKGKKPPVRNLVMLAPANFGSPLAHKGRSIVGRVVKGWNSEDTFETGTNVLKALEMASPYSWQLATDDRFSDNVFQSGGVRCTVIIGNHGYSGISSLANEDGSDGTVYVSSANLNCAQITLTVDRNSGKIDSNALQISKGKTAFLVLNGFDHSSITGKSRLPANLINSIIESLNMTATKFSTWCKQCDEETEKVRNKHQKSRDTEYHSFQNTVFQVIDDTNKPVKDYVLEFYTNVTDAKDKWATFFNKSILGKKHSYGDDPSYRSFMMNTTLLERMIDKMDESLLFSLSALPDFNHANSKVGYKSFGIDDIDKFELKQKDLKKYFSPDRTLLVKIILPRFQKSDVFELKTLD